MNKPESSKIHYNWSIFHYVIVELTNIYYFCGLKRINNK